MQGQLITLKTFISEPVTMIDIASLDRTEAFLSTNTSQWHQALEAHVNRSTITSIHSASPMFFLCCCDRWLRNQAGYWCGRLKGVFNNNVFSLTIHITHKQQPIMQERWRRWLRTTWKLVVLSFLLLNNGTSLISSFSYKINAFIGLWNFFFLKENNYLILIMLPNYLF